MTAILDHIQKQQDAAANLETVLSALEDLRLANLSPKVQTELIVMSRTLAHDLALALDIVNLPREGGSMNRRTLLQLAPVALFAGAVPAVAAKEMSVDPIIPLCQDFIEAHEAWQALDGDVVSGPVVDALNELLERIRLQPIKTAEGFAAFCRAVWCDSFISDESQQLPDIRRWQWVKVQEYAEARAMAG